MSNANIDSNTKNQKSDSDLLNQDVHETPNFKNSNIDKYMKSNSFKRVNSFKAFQNENSTTQFQQNKKIETLQNKLDIMKQKNQKFKQRLQQAEQKNSEQSRMISDLKRKIHNADINDGKMLETLQLIGQENNDIKKEKEAIERQNYNQKKQIEEYKSTIEDLKKQLLFKSNLYDRSQRDLKQSKELNDRIKQNRFDWKDDMQESQLLNQRLDFFDQVKVSTLEQSFGPQRNQQSQNKSQSVSELFEDPYKEQCFQNYEYTKNLFQQLYQQNNKQKDLLMVCENQIEELKLLIKGKDELLEQYQTKYCLHIQKQLDLQKFQIHTNLYEDLDIKSSRMNSDDELRDIMSEQSEHILQQHTEMQIQQTPLLTTKDPRNYKTISKIPKSKSQLNESNDIKTKSLLNEFQYKNEGSHEKYKLFKSPNERNYSDLQINEVQVSNRSSFQLESNKDQSYSEQSSNWDYQNIYEYIEYLKNYYREAVNSLKVKLECYGHLYEKIVYLLDVYLEEKDFDDDDIHSYDELANFKVEDEYCDVISARTLKYFQKLNQNMSSKIKTLNFRYTKSIVINQFEILRDVFDQIKNTNLIVPFIKEQIQQKIYGIQSSLNIENKQEKVLEDLSELKSKVISFLSSNSLKDIDHARRSVQNDDHQKIMQLKKEMKISKVNQNFLKTFLDSIQVILTPQQQDIMKSMKDQVYQVKHNLKKFFNQHRLLTTEIQNIEDFGDSFEILKKMRKNQQSKSEITCQIYQFFWISIKAISSTPRFKLADQIIRLQINSLSKYLNTLSKELEQSNFKKTPQNFQNQQIFDNYKYGDVDGVFKSRNQNQIENPFEYIFTQDIYNIKFYNQLLSHFLSPKLNQNYQCIFNIFYYNFNK